MIIKVLPRKYAEKFVKKGEVKFSFPSVWVEEGKKGNIGQGDLEEGIIGRDSANTVQYRNGDDYAVLHNLGYCCYGLDNVMFSAKEVSPGVVRKCCSVPYNYFKNFYSNDPSSFEDEPVIILIHPDWFANKIFDTLINSYKLKPENIIMTQVTYVDKKSPFHLKCSYPMELNYKGLEFIDQNEIRILLINDGSKEFKAIADNNGVISIGENLDFDNKVTIVEKYNEDMKCYIDGTPLVYNFPNNPI